MAFSRANALGWALYEVLTSAQMNSLDIDHANAIDGAAGGTYDPSAPVIFGADKLQAEPGDGDIVFQSPFVNIASHSETRYLPLTPVAMDSDWIYSSGGLPQQNGVTPGNQFEKWFQLSPVYGTLTAVSIYVIGASGHSALPATMPTLIVSTMSSGVVSNLGTQSDTSASVGAYETYHAITLGSLSSTAHLFRVALQGESSTNSIVGLIACQVVATITAERIFP